MTPGRPGGSAGPATAGATRTACSATGAKGSGSPRRAARKTGKHLIDGRTEAEWSRDAERALSGQYSAVMEVLRRYRLGDDIRVTAWLIALKVVAVTWRQVKDFAPEISRPDPVDGPDDGGFW